MPKAKLEHLLGVFEKDCTERGLASMFTGSYLMFHISEDTLFGGDIILGFAACDLEEGLYLIPFRSADINKGFEQFDIEDARFATSSDIDYVINMMDHIYKTQAAVLYNIENTFHRRVEEHRDVLLTEDQDNVFDSGIKCPVCGRNISLSIVTPKHKNVSGTISIDSAGVIDWAQNGREPDAGLLAECGCTAWLEITEDNMLLYAVDPLGSSEIMIYQGDAGWHTS